MRPSLMNGPAIGLSNEWAIGRKAPVTLRLRTRGNESFKNFEYFCSPQKERQNAPIKRGVARTPFLGVKVNSVPSLWTPATPKRRCSRRRYNYALRKKETASSIARAAKVVLFAGGC